MRPLFLVFTAFLLANPGGAHAQQIEGRKVDHFKKHGIWEVWCDRHLRTDEKRCFIQYVDVYKPRPGLRAAMVDILWRKVGPKTVPIFTFDIERGLSFADTNMTVSAGNANTAIDTSTCATNHCVIGGEAAEKLIASLRDGTGLSLAFTELDGTPTKRNWPLTGFGAAIDDLAKARAERDLP